MANSSTIERPIVFDARDPSELRSEYEVRSARMRDRMDVKSQSLGGQSDVAKGVDSAASTVDTRKLTEAYDKQGEQLEAKREVFSRWYKDPETGAQTQAAPAETKVAAAEAVPATSEDRWYHKLGRGIKETLYAPVRAVKWAFKEHPVISTVATTALAVYLAYQFGIPLAGYAGGAGDAHTGEVAEAVRSLGNFRPDLPVDAGRVLSPAVDYEGIKGAVDGMSQLP